MKTANTLIGPIHYPDRKGKKMAVYGNAMGQTTAPLSDADKTLVAEFAVVSTDLYEIRGQTLRELVVGNAEQGAPRQTGNHQCQS